jgi:hypothetical protein
VLEEDAAGTQGPAEHLHVAGLPRRGDRTPVRFRRLVGPPGGIQVEREVPQRLRRLPGRAQFLGQPDGFPVTGVGSRGLPGIVLRQGQPQPGAHELFPLVAQQLDNLPEGLDACLVLARQSCHVGDGDGGVEAISVAAGRGLLEAHLHILVDGEHQLRLVRACQDLEGL